MLSTPLNTSASYCAYVLDRTPSGKHTLRHSTNDWIFLRAGSRKKAQFLSPAYAARNIQSMGVWYHTDPHDQWKIVTWPVFFNGLGLSLRAKKLISTNDILK